MNGVHDDDVGFYFVSLRQNAVDVGFRENIEVFSFDSQALGAELQLAVGLFPRNVKNLSVLTENIRDLHQQRGFSDAGFARQKNHRAVYKTAAKHAVKLAKSRSRAHKIGKLKIFIGNGFA